MKARVGPFYRIANPSALPDSAADRASRARIEQMHICSAKMIDFGRRPAAADSRIPIDANCLTTSRSWHAACVLGRGRVAKPRDVMLMSKTRQAVCSEKKAGPWSSIRLPTGQERAIINEVVILLRSKPPPALAIVIGLLAEAMATKGGHGVLAAAGIVFFYPTYVLTIIALGVIARVRTNSRKRLRDGG